jgi:hypothetical protein
MNPAAKPKPFHGIHDSTPFKFCAEANQGTGIGKKFHGY